MYENHLLDNLKPKYDSLWQLDKLKLKLIEFEEITLIT